MNVLKNRKNGSYWLVALTIVISMLLSACGDSGGGSSFGGSSPNSDAPATGQGQVDAACDGKGEVSGQILVLTDPNQQLKSAPATLTLTQTGGEPKTFTTDADGNYTINDLDVNEYELEASLPGGLDGKTIEPRKKYLTVDDCYIETVSMVLLAQGIQAPAAPAPSSSQPQVVYVNNQPHYSIANNPFFWLWLFDRPNYYGYSYPPVYTTRIYNNNNIIYVPQQRPLPDTRYKYTTYADSSASTGSTKSPGVKAAPSPVSKGTTRLGTSGYSKPPVMKTPSSGGSSSSKGGTRSGGSTGSTGSQSGVKTPSSSSSNNKDSVPHPSGSSGDSVPHPSGSSNSSSSSKSGSSSSNSSSSGSKSGSSSSSSKSGSSSSSSKSGSSSSKGGTRGGKR